MSKAAHTPTPWNIVDHSWSDSSLYGADGYTACTFSIESRANEENQEALSDRQSADVLLVKTAVNHHQELVTRLKECVERMDKCRNILQTTAGNHAGNWGILDTSEARETLKKVIQ